MNDKVAPITNGKIKKDTRIKPGQVLNPNGRPKGSRNKITKAFLDAVAADFAEHGEEVIETVRNDSPKEYLTIVSRLVPQKTEITGNEGEAIELNSIDRVNRIAGLLNSARDAGARQSADDECPDMGTATRAAD